MKFDERELATILAALRLFQSRKKAPKSMEHFQDCTPLTASEIDALCERLSIADFGLRAGDLALMPDDREVYVVAAYPPYVDVYIRGAKPPLKIRYLEVGLRKQGRAGKTLEAWLAGGS